MLTQQFWSIFGTEYLCNDQSGFLMQATNFLEFFPSVEYLRFLAILAYKQKVRIFETPPIQLLIYQVKAYWSVGPWRPSDQSDAIVALWLYMSLYSYVSS